MIKQIYRNAVFGAKQSIVPAIMSIPVVAIYLIIRSIFH